ncbi:MAG: flavodoxin family protein, partial [Clostridiales bacterium]|nr:flavodoxin family protein [Clostridiales bacterium]
MKVLIATGSPRPHGNTNELIKYLSDELRQGGAEVRRVDLHGLSIAPCLGC